MDNEEEQLNLEKESDEDEDSELKFNLEDDEEEISTTGKSEDFSNQDYFRGGFRRRKSKKNDRDFYKALLNAI